MDWFACGSNIHRDPRTRAFAAELDITVNEAVGHLCGIYGALMQLRDPVGDLTKFANADLEDDAHWRGEPGRFAVVFRRHYQESNGTLRKWEKWNGSLIVRAEAERKRKKESRDAFYSMRAGQGAGREDGQGGGESSGPACVPDRTGPTNQPTGTTQLPTTPRSRKPRETGPIDGRDAASRSTWLTPIGSAWEAAYGPGSFPYPQAARELAPLHKAGFTPEEIARRLTWYLANKGSETALSDDERRRATHFRPSLRDFRLRFGQFDPSAPETP